MMRHLLETNLAYRTIKARRIALEISQSELSALSGINQASISKFERGLLKLAYDDYFKLLKELEIDVRFVYKEK